MASDGSMVFTIEADDKEAQASLKRIKKAIQNLEVDTATKNVTKKRLEEELEAIRAAQKSLNADNAADDAKQKELEKRYDSIKSKIERINDALKENADSMTVLKEEAAQYEQRLVGVTEETQEMGDAGEESGEKMSEAMKQATSKLEKFEKRIVGLAKHVFVFSLITMALRNMRTWLTNAVKSNDEAASAIARLKGALLTMAQPILQVVIPAFTLLVNILARVVAAIASVVSALFGTTAKESAEAAESLYDEQNAIKGVGGAAKKASKQLLAFDEIQKLSVEDAGGGGGGAAATGTIAPDFDFSGITDEITPRLKEILGYVTLIGAGLSLWKIAGNLPGALGDIGSKIAGVAIAVGGLLLLWDGLKDAWNNGVNWGNTIEMIGGLAAAMVGLYIAFGPVAAGIAGIVGGLALLVTGFRDAANNGMNLKNTLVMISGIIATGLGISILTGSWIPLLIAGVGAALLALVEFTGNGDELIQGLQTAFDGLREFVTGVFSGDWESAMEGLKKAGEGFKQAWGAIVDSAKKLWGKFTDWIQEKAGAAWDKVKEIWGKVANWFNEKVIEPIKQFFEPAINFISTLFEGCWLIIQAVWILVSGWFDEHVITPIKEGLRALWDACKDDVFQVWEDIKTIISAVAGFVEDHIIIPVKKLFYILVNGIIAYVEQGINKVIDAINGFMKGFNAIATAAGKIVGKDYSGVGVINHVSLPRVPALAAGAVIPPNREFLAVLGDQRSGNNIEAPEGLIREIVASEMGQVAALLQRLIEVEQSGKVFEANGVQFARLVYTTGKEETARHGGSLVNVTGRT